MKKQQSIDILYLGDKYTDKHTKQSIQEAQTFVLNCLSLVKEQNTLWCAFQSNSVADIMHQSDDFLPALLHMKETLKNEGFHLASLGANMRNTREISQIQIDIKNMSARAQYEMKEHITTLKSSITGKLPVLIPVHKNDRKTKLKLALEHVLSSLERKDNNNWVVLHSEGISSHEIKRELIKIGKKDIKVYASVKDEKDNLIDLKSFLGYDNQILVTQHNYFTGCEAANILYVLYDVFGTLKEPVRCCMMRAVENLFIIYVCDKERRNVEFDGVYKHNQLTVSGY